jgi:trans-AT polyketide synthase/acyltransferase/oxidoreductase domain-containing protein
VRYKLKGLERASGGSIVRQNRIIAKVSHAEVARAFLSPAPERIVQNLLARGEITAQQADLARQVPVADELCVEADSGGHTDQGVAFALFPAIAGIRDEILAQRNYPHEVRLGAAGGIGTPQAALAAFMLGADFIVTGSINQCTVEATTSEAVKDMLQGISVNDTDYAPAGDMFEIGAKVQVVKKGVFFPARANKLYDLYRQHNAIDEISPAIRKQIEEKYFKTTFESVWEETKAYYLRRRPEEIASAESSAKRKMALIFRWYFVRSTRLALTGDVGNRVDFQIQCGPALGSFNQWALGTPLENWRNRHVDVIALSIMEATDELLRKMLKRYSAKEDTPDREHQDGLRTHTHLAVE